jgi:LysM repeat protein
MQRHPWRRYAAPAAFLLAATIAVLLIRSGLHSASTTTSTAAAVATTTTGKARSTATTATTATTTTRRGPGTTTTASGPRFWVVQAGDTFAVISAKTGVPVANIEQLNPNVKSTSLFIGERLRLR